MMNTNAVDNAAYYKEAQSHIDETSFMSDHGISKETAAKNGVGFDPYWHDPVNSNAATYPAVIIPLSNESYYACVTSATNLGADYTIGPQNIFMSLDAEKQDMPIFITYSPIDALSISEFGYPVIAICDSNAYTTDMIKRVMECMQGEHPIISALGNNAVCSTIKKLIVSMAFLYNLVLVNMELPEKYRNINDMLVKEPSGFKRLLCTTAQEAIKEFKATTSNMPNVDDSKNIAENSTNKTATDSSITAPHVIADAPKPVSGIRNDGKDDVSGKSSSSIVVRPKAPKAVVVKRHKSASSGKHKSISAHINPDKDETKSVVKQNDDKNKRLSVLPFSEEIDAVIDDIKKAYNITPISTGIPSFDDALNGGLRQELIVVGAGTSVGKTALLQQIGETAAAAGKAVLYVSNEPTKSELLIRGMCRQSYLKYGDKGLSFYEMADWICTNSKDAFIKGNKSYMSTAGKMFIYAPGHTFTSADIEALFEHIVIETGEVPIVIVDYLQRVASQKDYSGNFPERYIVTDTINMLRRICDTYNTPVIVASAINRDSYKEAKSCDIFKDSSMIEYTADVLLSLWKDDPDKDTVASGAAKISCIKMKVLKNRKGNVPKNALTLDYVGKGFFFFESEKTRQNNLMVLDS